MSKRWTKWLPCLFLCVTAILTVLMDVYIAGNLLDGDASDPLYRGWTIVQDGDFFTSDYACTTEIRLLDANFVFSLFFRLTGRWALARVLGVATMQAIYVLSFLFMTRQAGVKRSVRLVAAGLLLSPFSTPYARIVLYHAYYLVYMTSAFWMTGLTLAALNRRGKSRGKTAAIVGLLWLLWAYAGLGGVRQMMILGAPMLVFCAVELYRALNREGWQKELSWRRQPLWQTDAARLTLLMLGSCLCFLATFLVQQNVLLPYFGVTSIEGGYRFLPDTTAQKFADVANAWLIAAGARVTQEPMLSLRGVALLAAMLPALWTLIRSLRWREEEETGKALLRCLFGLCTLVSALIFLIDDSERYYQLYFVPAVAMLIPSLTVELDRPAEKGAGKKLLALSAAVCLAFGGGYTARFILSGDQSMDLWNGLGYTEMDTVEQARDATEYLLENEYTHALAPYWYASVMVETSDGALAVAPLETFYDEEEPENSFVSIRRWGTYLGAFQADRLPETLAIVLPYGDKLDLFLQYFPDADLVYEAEPLSICEIDAGFLKFEKE